MSPDKIKNTALLILTGLFLVFFSLWMFKKSDAKSDIRAWQKQIDSIQKTRDSLTKDVALREAKVAALETDIRDREIRVAQLDQQLNQAFANLKLANDRVATTLSKRSKLELMLEAAQLNPKNRTGDTLLVSLKDKLRSK